VVEFVTPFRDKTLAYLDDPAQLEAILAAGAERARAVTAPTLARVFDRLGFVPASTV
jgi:tryptophanyl-tRNA synthetase